MATRADVARLAGVSQAAVSYAISGKAPIAAATRERIFAAMTELNYRPNALAKGLAGGRSMNIALLLPTQDRGISSADFEYVLGAANAARELGYHLLLWPTESGDMESARDLARTGMIDGVILMEVQLDDERLAYLRDSDVEVALIGRVADPDEDLFADRDFDAVTELAVDHLFGLGHRELLFLSGPRDFDRSTTAVQLADSGFQAACARRGLRTRIAHLEPTIDAGRDYYAEHLEAGSDVTGVVAMNPEATIGVLAGAREHAASVPSELSVISIATPTSLVAASTPALTTISPPAEAIGRATARLLIARLAGLDIEPPEHLWTGDLVVRETTGPVRPTADMRRE